MNDIFIMNNQCSLTQINSILKHNFNYKTINKFNVHLFKALSNFSYLLNYTMLYDLIEIIYHSYYRRYDELISFIKSLENKYTYCSSQEIGSMIIFCNTYLFPHNKLFVNYTEKSQSPVNISIFVYVISITNNISLLKSDTKVATDYNSLITRAILNINKMDKIPNYFKKEVLLFITKNNIEIV